MKYERLLAKSCYKSQREQPTIAWHTKCILDCANRLLKLRCRDAVDAMGLPQSAIAVLERIVRFAAWLHDIGKCASTFQKAVRNDGEQPFRHEAISWYITTQILDDFLANYIPDRTERWMVAVCVAGHHRKFYKKYDRENQVGAISDPLGESELYLSHKDFRNWIELIPTDQILGELPSFDNKILSAKCLFDAILSTVKNYDERIFPILNDEQKKIISLAKSFLMASDISASALSQRSIEFDWIDKKLGDRADTDVRSTLLKNKLDGKPLREFQEIVAQSKTPWTLLKAGCGTGKTAAACEWATRNHKDRQLWLTYPTTGTATEGFKDYVMDTQLEGSLQHSRALLDLEELKMLDVVDVNELPQREIALRGWGADTVVATVDTVLGIMQNHKAGHYAYPGILKGALVFDEIHAYDKCLFGSFLRFLEAHPNIPCLLMTASLQENREQRLKELHRRLFQKELPTFNGPKELEEMPRYFQSREVPWVAVEYCRQHGGKILWVSNTVDRCIEVGRQAKQMGIEKPLFYHSRYKYSDRIERHKDVVDAFNNKNIDFVFASTTQVAEMSLDISADLLITDLAPIPAMIQRLGRLNRRADTTLPTQLFPFIVNKQRKCKLYTPEEIKHAEEWLDCLPYKISQRDLIHCWSQENENQSWIHVNWLDEPLWTRGTSLREASPGVNVILQKDSDCIKKGEKPISYYQIDMPPGKTEGMNILKGRFVATDKHIHYNEFEGASWLKK